MATTALILNVLVAGLAFFAFRRSGHFSWRLAWPFLAVSVPAAAVGGWLPVSGPIYRYLLAAVLFFAAFRLWIRPPASAQARRFPKLAQALPAGGAIGLVSGMVGVGGGIFLSPLLLLCGWADVRQAAAVSALFIVLNSLAGLSGRLAAGSFEVGSFLPLMAAAFAGGWIGSRLGARHLPSPWLCRFLAMVLVVAAGKLAFLR